MVDVKEISCFAEDIGDDNFKEIAKDFYYYSGKCKLFINCYTNTVFLTESKKSKKWIKQNNRWFKKNR